jgi:hypothetical protein
MFKILGADGKEYGPVAIDQIRKWISEGRANRDTMAQQTGDSSWKPLGQYADLADLFGAPPPIASAIPPTAPSASSAPAIPAVPVAPVYSTAPRAGADARTRAEQMVSGPAIGLMVTAGLGLLFGLIGLIMSIGGTMPSMPGVDPEFARIITKLAYGPIAIGTKVIGLGISGLILFGAIRMQSLTSHGLAMAVAILAMIPCFSPCCLLGLPFGIWALVVLSKPEVKSQFK